MNKKHLKFISVIIAGCMLLSGCNSAIFGIPGLFYEANETITDMDLTGIESFQEDMEADIWSWPDTEDYDPTYWEDDYTYEVPEGAEPGSVTILLYMNGSSLETEAGCATKDLMEILNAGYSEDVNIVVQTMGTKYWAKSLGIASDRSQTYIVGKYGLELVRDDLGQLDCTSEETLSEFIEYGTENYPAERNILLFWNHGGGPAYGFGMDEFQNYYDNLSINEIVRAIKQNKMHYDFIGMDCCMMSSLEIAYALRDCCDYAVLSEDFESQLGWYYTNWISALYEDPSISTCNLGKIIVDDMVRTNEEDSLNGDRAILALIDESKTETLWKKWIEFAYENEDKLLATNYSQEMEGTGKGLDLVKKKKASTLIQYLIDETEEYYEDYLSEYCITDLIGLASIIDSDTSDDLIDAARDVLKYVCATSDDMSLTGLSVTLPYGDSVLYNDLTKMLRNCGFSSEYIEWLHAFCSVTGSERFNWDNWENNFWGEWGNYENPDIWGSWGSFEIPDYMEEWDF